MDLKSELNVNTSTLTTKPKLLVILGQTATGKSSLGVDIAKQYKGEVISADSRQIYAGLDIGTGKIPREEMGGIPHHLLSIIEPSASYSVAHFKGDAEKAIRDIYSRNNLPILVGGTGLYIHSVVDNWAAPQVPQNKTLRKELEQRTNQELFTQLQKADPERAETIDRENPRRLIRAIEIADALGHVPKIETSFPTDYTHSLYNVLQIGLQLSDEELRENIYTRVEFRLKNGFIDEVRNLNLHGIPWGRLSEIGLGYTVVAEFLQGMRTRESLQEAITAAEWQYAKRQMRWFKRDTRIIWHSAHDTQKIKEDIETFLS